MILYIRTRCKTFWRHLPAAALRNTAHGNRDSFIVFYLHIPIDDESLLLVNSDTTPAYQNRYPGVTAVVVYHGQEFDFDRCVDTNNLARRVNWEARGQLGADIDRTTVPSCLVWNGNVCI